MSTYSSSIFYWETSDPAVSAQGLLHIVYVQMFNSLSSGLFKASSSTNVTLYEEDIDLSHVAPSSIDVVEGTCGDGVTFSGTTGGAIGIVRTRTRRVKDSTSDKDLRALMSLQCSVKEVTKKECSESRAEVSEATIHFPREADMAPRFAKALQDIVVLSGGRSDSY